MDIYRRPPTSPSPYAPAFETGQFPGGTLGTAPPPDIGHGHISNRNQDAERERVADKARNKRLKQRQIRGEIVQKGSNAKALAKARKFAETTQNSILARKIAMRAVLTGELPVTPADPREPVSTHDLVNDYLGLTEAFEYLSQPADIDDAFFQARLYPIGGSPMGPIELSKKLVAAHDATELAELLSGVDGLEQDKEKLYAELKDIRGNPKELMEYLSRAQGMDSPPGPKRFVGSVESLYERVTQAEEGEANAVGELLQEYGLRGTRQELTNKARHHRGSAQKLAAFVNRELSLDSDPEENRIALRDQVHDALAELELAFGDVITTNLDLEDTAARSNLPKQFVKSYSEMLFEAPSFADAALQMLEKFGLQELPATVGMMGNALEKMKQQLDTMKRGLGQEMHETDPDTVKLHATITGLSYMHMLTTLIETTESYVAGMNQAATASGILARPLDATELLKGLIGIVASSASWLQPNQFENMLRKAGVTEKQDIAPLHKIAQILREMPDKTFADNHARKTAMDGIQLAIDSAVRREDEALDAADSASQAAAAGLISATGVAR